MKLVPAGLGAEPKKLMILGVLLAVAGVAYWMNSGPNIPEGAVASPSVAVKTPPVPVPPPRTAGSSYGPRSTTRGGRAAGTNDDFKPTLKLPEGMEISRIDPTLKMDLLAKVRQVSVEGGARSLFEFYTPPPPPPPKVDPIKPGPVKVTEEIKPSGAPKGPAPPPPPPPIPLKFYGYSGALRSNVRRAFFLDGEDIVQAGENETIRNRYKILRIGVNSAVVEDTVAKNQQTLQLADEAP
jgi:hypothetical protein